MSAPRPRHRIDVPGLLEAIGAIIGAQLLCILIYHWIADLIEGAAI